MNGQIVCWIIAGVLFVGATFWEPAPPRWTVRLGWLGAAFLTLGFLIPLVQAAVVDANLPTPDPTVLTTEALARAIGGERDYIDSQLDVLRERLRGIDRATALLNETVNRVPTDVQKEVSHLRELTEERFASVQTQFRERDTRQERESRDNKVAVDAAFAAQKEAASEQNKSNTLAIDKSERSGIETANKNAELNKTATDALAKELADFKERITRIESVKQGGKETLTGIYALTGFLVSLLILLGILAAAGVFKT